ncbi:MAG TPA: sulfurtransferase-like selenium metabolism protein YedF [Syntrophomonadaceae bacterium]|nr:sulfurtransferase-like selenium metabolism protein YedF [Syntrophomonadaceae bacterium]
MHQQAEHEKGWCLVEKIIDARGLSCPEPVILTKKAMDGGLISLTTIVNENAALENISKLARTQGYDIDVETVGAEFHIHLNKAGEMEEDQQEVSGDVAVLISSRLFGQGEEELGQVLMKSFLFSLNEVEGRIKQVIFINSGVFLTTEGSPVLEHLNVLLNRGVEVLSCGTCLDFYGLKEKLLVGTVTNMYTIVEILTTASRAITL